MPGDSDSGSGPHDPPNASARSETAARVRKSGLILLAGLIIVILALTIPRTREFFNGYAIVLSKPELKGNWIEGTFQFQHKINGLSWNGTGGACIVADIADLVPAGDEHKAELKGGMCTTQAQCNVAGEAQRWHGYCFGNAEKPGRCFYEPAEGDQDGELCRRSIDYDSPKIWKQGQINRVPDPNTVARFDVRAFYREHTNGRPARWALVGVLNSDNAQHEIHGEPVLLNWDSVHAPIPRP